MKETYNPLIPAAGQVWKYEQPAKDGQSAYTFNVQVLAADPQSNRVVIANFGLSWTEAMRFEDLRERATLIGTATVG